MFERFSRSWGLIKASAGVLAKDKELLAFPLGDLVCVGTPEVTADSAGEEATTGDDDASSALDVLSKPAEQAPSPRTRQKLAATRCFFVICAFIAPYYWASTIAQVADVLQACRRIATRHGA